METETYREKQRATEERVRERMIDWCGQWGVTDLHGRSAKLRGCGMASWCENRATAALILEEEGDKNGQISYKQSQWAQKSPFANTALIESNDEMIEQPLGKCGRNYSFQKWLGNRMGGREGARLLQVEYELDLTVSHTAIVYVFVLPCREAC